MLSLVSDLAKVAPQAFVCFQVYFVLKFRTAECAKHRKTNFAKNFTGMEILETKKKHGGFPRAKINLAFYHRSVGDSRLRIILDMPYVPTFHEKRALLYFVLNISKASKFICMDKGDGYDFALVKTYGRLMYGLRGRFRGAYLGVKIYYEIEGGKGGREIQVRTMTEADERRYVEEMEEM